MFAETVEGLVRFFSVTLKMRITPRPFLIYVSCNEEIISSITETYVKNGLGVSLIFNVTLKNLTDPSTVSVNNKDTTVFHNCQVFYESFQSI